MEAGKRTQGAVGPSAISPDAQSRGVASARCVDELGAEEERASDGTTPAGVDSEGGERRAASPPSAASTATTAEPRITGCTAAAYTPASLDAERGAVETLLIAATQGLTTAPDLCYAGAVTDIESSLNGLFAAEREARRLHDELTAVAQNRRDALVKELTKVISNAKALDDELEAAVRLVASARLLGELEGADVVDLLIDVLDSELPEARSEAGEQLQGLAFDRFKEVALGVERALKRYGKASPALVELPYLLVDIPEGGVVKLLGAFLQHADADAVAAAIETLVILGDASVTKLLLPLQGDKRISVVGEDDEENEVTIGELAVEAIELLRENAPSARG